MSVWSTNRRPTKKPRCANDSLSPPPMGKKSGKSKSKNMKASLEDNDNQKVEWVLVLCQAKCNHSLCLLAGKQTTSNCAGRWSIPSPITLTSRTVSFLDPVPMHQLWMEGGKKRHISTTSWLVTFLATIPCMVRHSEWSPQLPKGMYGLLRWRTSLERE